VHGPVYLVSVVPAGTPVLLAPGQPAVEVEVVVGLDVVVVDEVVDEVVEEVVDEVEVVVAGEVLGDEVVLEVLVGLFHRPMRVEGLGTHLRHR